MNPIQYRTLYFAIQHTHGTNVKNGGRTLYAFARKWDRDAFVAAGPDYGPGQRTTGRRPTGHHAEAITDMALERGADWLQRR